MTHDPLAQVLSGDMPPGVLSWPAELPAQRALDEARDAGWETAVLELS